MQHAASEGEGAILRSVNPKGAGSLQVTYLPVQQNGLIDMEQLKAAIRPTTALVSIMAVNNEIGACPMGGGAFFSVGSATQFV